MEEKPAFYKRTEQFKGINFDEYTDIGIKQCLSQMHDLTRFPTAVRALEGLLMSQFSQEAREKLDKEKSECSRKAEAKFPDYNQVLDRLFEEKCLWFEKLTEATYRKQPKHAILEG